MKKKIMAAMLAALVLSQGMTAFANPSTNNPKGDEHTTIGIMESTTNVGQASFEVPLYVTTAAISNQTALVCPEGYDITNTAGTNGGRAIGVVRVSVEKLGTWNLVSATPSGQYDVKMTIGDLTLPAVSAQNEVKTVNIATEGQNSVFYDNGKSKLQAIPSGKSLSVAAGGTDGKGLHITGEVKSVTRTNQKAAAQFRIRYVISALDDAGDPIGSTYVGDNRAAAGF